VRGRRVSAVVRWPESKAGLPLWWRTMMRARPRLPLRADEVPCGSQNRSTYMRSRTHLALGKDTPMRRPVTPPAAGRIVAISQVGSLHHRYHRVAAKTTVGVPPTDFSTTHCPVRSSFPSGKAPSPRAAAVRVVDSVACREGHNAGGGTRKCGPYQVFKCPQLRRAAG
jgi:hypothetical protein